MHARAKALLVGAAASATILAVAASGNESRAAHGVAPLAARPAAAALVAATSPAAPITRTAGFGQPQRLTPRRGNVDSPVAAVAPNGRTAVLWRQAGAGTYDYRYMAAFGPSATELGRPVVVRAAAKLDDTYGASLLAQPDGGFVACFDEDRRSDRETSGCAFAPPTGGFGPLRVIERASWKQRAGFSAVVRADGRLAVVLSRQRGGGRRELRSTTLGAGGDLGPIRPLTTLSTDDGYSLAAVDDGTVAVSWATGPGEAFEGNRTPTLRLMPPGSDQFMPPARFTRDRVGGSPGLTGGSSLLVRYATGSEADDNVAQVVQRRPDGSFTSPRQLPRPGPGYLYGGVLSLPDGSPLAITSAEEQSENDCGNSTSGSVGVGPLVESSEPVTPGTRLSDPKQIAQYPQADTLADGTVITSWGDAMGGLGDARLEVAIRPAGSTTFAPPQVLPQVAARDVSLAAGGDQAILVWTVGAAPDGPAHLVTSALRRGGPYATPARRPAHPGTGCF